MALTPSARQCDALNASYRPPSSVSARDNKLASLQPPTEDISGKENRPPALVMGGKQQVQKAGSKGQRMAGKSSKQMFLDLGQRDFSASKCSICGMVYAKGQEDDEKLHKSFHQSAVQGLKFQGWTQERVVLMEPFKGRLIMVLPTDPAPQVKKVHEVCAFVEKAHGIAAGWLMAAPQCKVFLYVSLQKRVVGLVVVEPIKQAYRVAAPGPVNEEADSCRPSAAPQQQNVQQLLPVSLAASAAAAAASSCERMEMDQKLPAGASGKQANLGQQRPKLQQQTLLWPGLHHNSSSRKRSRLQALLQGGAASAGDGGESRKPGRNMLLLGSQGVCTGTTRGDSSELKADSCPPSLLMAAELMQVNSAVAAASAAQPGAAAAAAAAVQATNATAGCEEQPQQLKQQQPEAEGDPLQRQPCSQHSRQQQLSCTAACDSGPCYGGSSKSLPSNLVAAGAGRGRHKVHSSSILSGEAAAASGSAISLSKGGSVMGADGSSRSRSNQITAVARGAAGFCMLADKRKAVHALVGVRMVWVSSEQRRTGLATKLLDAARCNMTPGYVVPRNQLAFTQPTEEGTKLAVAFTGTQQFMVYGLE